MVNDMPHLKWTRTFVTVVKAGSMATAASELGYVPSAVSQHIGNLERVLQVELLVRRPGSRIAITPAGRALMEAAGPLLRANAEFADSLRSISRSETPSIVVGTYATAMHFLLPEVLRRMQSVELLPEIAIREMETPAALPLLRSGALDMLVGYKYLANDPPLSTDPLSVTLIGNEPMLLVGPVGQPLTFDECVAGYWTIGSYPLDDRRLLRQWSEQLRFRPKVTFETADPNSSMQLVASGLAVSLLPATVVAAGIRRGATVQIVPMPPAVPQPYREVLVVTRSTFQPPFLNPFVELMRDTLERQSAIAI